MNNLTIALDSWGFFSQCSHILGTLIGYYNMHKYMAYPVDTSQCFALYKPSNLTDDITRHYFLPPSNNKTVTFKDTSNQYVHFGWGVVHTPYHLLEFDLIKPFVEEYFTPALEIQEITRNIEKKYSLDYNNKCCVYYRGNDKFDETKLASYENFVTKMKQVQLAHPNITFVLQSDETNFLEAALKAFPQATIFEENTHMRTMKFGIHTTPKLNRDDNYRIMKYYLAIVNIISNCRIVITCSSMGGLWTTLYRGNIHNVHQFLEGEWIGFEYAHSYHAVYGGKYDKDGICSE